MGTRGDTRRAYVATIDTTAGIRRMEVLAFGIIGLVCTAVGTAIQFYQAYMGYRAQRSRKQDSIDRMVCRQDPQEQQQWEQCNSIKQQYTWLDSIQPPSNSASPDRYSTYPQLKAAAIREYFSRQQVKPPTREEAEAVNKRLKHILDTVKERDEELQQRKQAVIDSRHTWSSSRDNMLHMSMGLDALMAKRKQMREIQKTYPEMDPDDWRFVVVCGPAGQGKTTFIRAVLEDLHYSDLVNDKELIAANPVSVSGTGTRNRPAPYVLKRHKIILQDSVGDSEATKLLQGEALAADVLIVFMGDHNRGEKVHGDAALLGYRLRSVMKTLFIVPRADTYLPEVAENNKLSFDVKLDVAAEVHRQLLAIKLRAAEHSVPLAADTLKFLDDLPHEEDARGWIDWDCKWVEVLFSFCSRNFNNNNPTQKLPDRVCPEKFRERLGDDWRAILRHVSGSSDQASRNRLLHDAVRNNGFGNDWEVRPRASRCGVYRGPDGQPRVIKIQAKKVPVFKAGKDFVKRT